MKTSRIACQKSDPQSKRVTLLSNLVTLNPKEWSPLKRGNSNRLRCARLWSFARGPRGNLSRVRPRLASLAGSNRREWAGLRLVSKGADSESLQSSWSEAANQRQCLGTLPPLAAPCQLRFDKVRSNNRKADTIVQNLQMDFSRLWIQDHHRFEKHEGSGVGYLGTAEGVSDVKTISSMEPKARRDSKPQALSRHTPPWRHLPVRISLRARGSRAARRGPVPPPIWSLSPSPSPPPPRALTSRISMNSPTAQPQTSYENQ